MIIIVKTKKNPITKDIIWDIFFSKRVYPTTIGIKGITQGDKTDAAPAKNEINGPIFIFIS